MGKTILSNTISKIGQPVSKENNNRRKIAFRNIATCLEMCYREFITFHSMETSPREQNALETAEKSWKIVNLINEFKEEINNELLRIACLETIGQEGVEEAIRSEINEIIKLYSDEGNEHKSGDLAKNNVIMDFEKMNETLASRRLNHIRRYPTIDIEENRVPQRHRRSARYEGLAPWQIDVMFGNSNGLFGGADCPNDEGKVIYLDDYRRRKNGSGRNDSGENGSAR